MSCAPPPALPRATSPRPRTQSPRPNASSVSARPISPSSARARRAARALAAPASARARSHSRPPSAPEPWRESRRRSPRACGGCDAPSTREGGPGRDSAAAARQRLRAERVDSRARGLEQVAQDLGAARAADSPLAAPQDAARAAGSAMQRAAAAAAQRQAPQAAAAGSEAERRLAAVPRALRGQRDSLAREWRRETLAALDRALFETAALAERQPHLAGAPPPGDVTSTTRSQQGSLEEGTDAA